MRTICRTGLFSVLAFYLSCIGGCSVNRGAITDTCAEGSTEPCECPSGLSGTRTCRDGEFEECVCEDGPDTGNGGAGGNGASYAGNGGNGGQNGAEPIDIDSGPTGGEAGSESDAGDARVLIDATAADTSDMDTGAGDSGFDAGETDTGVPDTGTPDTGAPDTGTPDTGAPDAGEFDAGSDAGEPDGGEDAGESYVYGPCDEQGECSGGLTCVVEGDGAGSYCSISCNGQNQNCPVRPSGSTVTRRCSSLTDMCRLNCASGECPSGMQCYEDDYYTRFTCVWP